MGHRGGLMENPENTMAGVEDAIKKNFCIELDLQKSKDGRFFLCHDHFLERITG